jgi:hypothetical protein
MKITVGFLLGTLLFMSMPMFAFGQAPGPVGTPDEGLIPCGNTKVDNTVSDPCTFGDLITLAQTVINFLIFKIAAPLAAVMFIWAGFLYLTAAGNEGQVKKAHELFWAVFIGLVIALAAWLMVSLVLRFFLGDTSIFNFLG